MMVKHLVQHGNSKAIVIERAVLQAAGLDENALFQIVVDPNGVVIQSVKPIDENAFRHSLDKTLKKYDKNLKSLSKR